MNKIYRIVVFLIVALCVAGVPQQAVANVADSAAILKKIYEGNAQVRTLQAPYTHHRVSGNDVSNRKGDFYYIAASQQLAMRYTEPEGRYFVVSSDFLYVSVFGCGITTTLSFGVYLLRVYCIYQESRPLSL